MSVLQFTWLHTSTRDRAYLTLKVLIISSQGSPTFGQSSFIVVALFFFTVYFQNNNIQEDTYVLT